MDRRNRKRSTLDKRRKATQFSLHAPSAKEIYVAGSFNGWSPSELPMKRDRKGFWRAAIQLAPGRYEYKFVVDGCWCCDVTDGKRSEMAEGCVPNEFGTMNRVLEVA